jgi:hypothetical protein
MNDQELMERIHTEAAEPIAEASAGSSLPPAFLAGLVANETGAQFAAGGLAAAARAKRFEHGVLGDLWNVLLERKANFGSIGREDLLDYVSRLNAANIISGGFTAGIVSVAQRLDDLASSHGLTQIMGYQLLQWGATLNLLEQPFTNLQFAVKLLGQFAKRWTLNPAADFPQLFACWNTGRPFGATADPNYAANGLARMKLYEAILSDEGVHSGS